MRYRIPPSVFNVFPVGSRANKTQCEVVALNIMKIRDRLKKWDISWEEYKEQRSIDGEFSEGEKDFFEKVIPMIEDSVHAMAFCDDWLKLGKNYLKDDK